MSRSVSAPSSVTNTSPCWNGFIVPGSTLRYGSSFCMVTRRPRERRSRPRLDAVRPLPSEEATPPVTKMCFVVSTTGFKSTSSGEQLGVALGPPARLVLGTRPPCRLDAGGEPERVPLLRVGQQVVDMRGEGDGVTDRHEDAGRPDE